MRTKKAILAVLATVMVLALTACGGGNPAREGAPASPDPAETPLTLETSPSPAPDATHSKETCPDGKRLFYHGGDTGGLFPLYAMLPEENIYLYGIHPSGMILYKDGIGRYFNWPGLTPRLVLPQLLYHDFDGCGEKELAVALYVSSGTGVAAMDLHMLKIEGRDNWYLSYTEHTLFADDAHDWMTEPIAAVLADDKNSFTVDICGESFTIEDEFTHEWLFTGIAFRDIVRFEFEGNQIRTKIPVGALYLEAGVPQFFGEIEADVIFNGKNIRLENYTFTLY